MEFRQRYIRGESVMASTQRGLLAGHFDLLLVAPSWDSRCVGIKGCAKLAADDCILLLFSGRDGAGHRERNEKVLTEYVHASCKRVVSINGPSLSLEDTWDSLWDAIRRKATAAARPMRIAMDLSTFPRFYSLGVIAGCLRLGYASSISVFYSEGAYTPAPGTTDLPEYPFSVGEWRTVPVPFLEGTRAPSRNKYILVSVGFEGAKTLRVLSREDPDRISVLFPDPGTRREYPVIAEEQNKFIIELYNVPPEQIVRAHAADAIAAWKSLSLAALERPTSEDSCYLSCGSKPHALGMALRALCTQFPCVLYNVPEKYNDITVMPTGQYWVYDIQDLSIMKC
jgi:hypothetical protein